jgi:thiamine-phosphate pyrophosphorylase
MTKLLVEHEVAFIQLRMKNESHDEVRKMAEKMAKIIQGSSSRFIINDDPLLALEIGADGVHVGQSDMAYEKARVIVGPDAIVGVSTPTLDDAVRACAKKPDYIGIGPVFPTTTKLDADPSIGLAGMQQQLAVATVSAVVIGGIDLSNLRSVLGAGARNFCMMRQLIQADDPERVLAEISLIYKEYYPQ